MSYTRLGRVGQQADVRRRVPLAAAAGGVLESRTFPGLRLASDALLADDGAGVLGELRRGIETPAHAEFVARLLTAASS